MQCMRKRWIPGVIAVTLYWYGALLYIWWPAGWPAIARVCAKAAPILLLAAVVSGVLRRAGALPAAALLFSAAGDIAGDSGPQGFLPSIALFGMAQVLYTVYFARFWRWRRLRLVPLGLCLVWGALMAWQLAGAQALAGPVLKSMVFLYIAVILCMVITALFAAGMPFWLPVGAVLFFVSDSLIAMDRFLFDVPHGGVWVMLTYSAAQFCIALGVILRRRESRSMLA